MLLQLRRPRSGHTEESGASAVEYGLLVAAIAAIIVLIVFVLGKFVHTAFDDTCQEIATGDANDTTVTASCT